jgi:hypothetical protein
MNAVQLCSAEILRQDRTLRREVILAVSRPRQSVSKKASFRTSDTYLQPREEFHLEVEGQDLHTTHDRNLDKQRVEA